MSQELEKKSFFNDLWDRRFFQFLATYVGVCWGILQFLHFATTRYQLDGAIIDKFLLIAAILLPSVIVFIYNHGRAGDDEWKSYEKILIPVNIIIALGASFFISSAGAAESKIDYQTEQIIITDEDGEEIKRNVPNSNSSATVILFPLENKKSVKDLEWLRYSTDLLELELSQDVRISGVSPFGLRREYADYDYSLQDDIPIGTKVKIAKDNYCDYFISSSVVPKEGGLQVDIMLYNSETGTIKFQNTFSGPDIYTIYDKASKEINNAIFDTNYFEKEGVPDLPAASLITSNEESLNSYLQAKLEMEGNDVSLAIEKLEQSVEQDPKCAMCYANLGQIYSVEDITKAQENLKKAMLHSSSLSESQQLLIKYFNYSVLLKPDKAEKLLYLWKSLYPNDKTSYNVLINRLMLRRSYKEAIKIGEEAVERGHAGSILPKLAELCITTNDLQGAKRYLEQFKELYPSKAKENSQLGDLYIKTGELDKAKSFYEDLSILKGDDHGIFLKLANLSQKLGENEDAKAYFEEAYFNAKDLKDSLGIKNEYAKFLLRKGKAIESLNEAKEMEQGYRKILPPLIVNSQIWLQLGPIYGYADSLDAFREQIPTRFPNQDAQSDFLRNIAEFLANMTDDNFKVEEFEAQYSQVKPMMLASVGPAFDDFMQGYISFKKGDPQTAMGYLQSYVDSTGVDIETTGEVLFEIYFANESYKDLISLTDETIKSDPTNPMALTFKAKALAKMGKEKEATKIIDRVLEYYSEADENYKFYELAKALKESLGG